MGGGGSGPSLRPLLSPCPEPCTALSSCPHGEPVRQGSFSPLYPPPTAFKRVGPRAPIWRLNPRLNRDVRQRHEVGDLRRGRSPGAHSLGCPAAVVWPSGTVLLPGRSPAQGLQSCLAFLTTLLPSANKFEPCEKAALPLRSSLKHGRGLVGVHSRAPWPLCGAWSGRACSISGQAQRARARGVLGWHTRGL